MNDDKTPWEYKSDSGKTLNNPSSRTDSQASNNEKSSPKSVSWEALEFIDHSRGFGWYVSLVLITGILAASLYLLTKDKVATGIIIAVGIIVGMFVNQKPNKAKYEISESGVSINGKVYSYNNYKSFTINNEGGLNSLNLFPLKRFIPPLSVFFDPKDESKIMKVLGDYLPYEERKLDVVERLTRRLHI